MHSILLIENEPDVRSAWQGSWILCGTCPSVMPGHGPDGLVVIEVAHICGPVCIALPGKKQAPYGSPGSVAREFHRGATV